MNPYCSIRHGAGIIFGHGSRRVWHGGLLAMVAVMVSSVLVATEPPRYRIVSLENLELLSSLESSPTIYGGHMLSDNGLLVGADNLGHGIVWTLHDQRIF